MSIDEKKSVTLLHGVPKDNFFDLLKQRKAEDIFVLEGRPKLQGAKVLCKKLLQHKLTPTLITDNMAGFLFYKEMVKEIWIGYQSLNGAGAFCSIGALILGVLAKRHNIPVYLFPSAVKSKAKGSPKDIFQFEGKRIAAKGVKGYVPLIEKLPQKYISRIYS